MRQIWPSICTPETEIEPIRRLSAHVGSLKYSVETWESALHLYAISYSPPIGVVKKLAWNWRFLAAETCVLELFNLRWRMAKIQSEQLKDCPSIQDRVEVKLLRSARKRFDDYFPGVEGLRHALAHKGENESHPDIHLPNGMSGLVGFQTAHVYSAPHKGVRHELSITTESIGRVKEVVEEFESGFDQLAISLEAEGHLN